MVEVIKIKTDEDKLARTWGWHMSIDLAGCEHKLVEDEVNIRSFGEYIVPAINMERHGDIQTVHFGKEDKTGWTLSLLLTTSNICGHFCDNTGEGYLDIFSCKEIDEEVVLEAVHNYFKPKHVRVLHRVRGNDYLAIKGEKLLTRILTAIVLLFSMCLVHFKG